MSEINKWDHLKVWINFPPKFFNSNFLKLTFDIVEMDNQKLKTLRRTFVNSVTKKLYLKWQHETLEYEKDMSEFSWTWSWGSFFITKKLIGIGVWTQEQILLILKSEALLEKSERRA